MLIFDFVDKSLIVTNQIKAREQNFHVVLFITLFKAVETFNSVRLLCVYIAKCDHSNKNL